MKKLIFLLLILALTNVFAQKKKAFTLDDAMKFKSIRYSQISNDGNWICFEANPDRGDGDVVIQSTTDSTKYLIERGSKAKISKNSGWVAAIVQGKQLDIENAKTPKDKPKNGIAILNLSNGKKSESENIANFQFSNDSKWIAFSKNKNEDLKPEKFKKKELGSDLYLKHLASGTEIRVDFVTNYQFDSLSKFLFYTVSTLDGKKDGIYVRNLNLEFAPEYSINNEENRIFSNITWNDKREILAFTINEMTTDGKASNGSLLLWDYSKKEVNTIVSKKQTPDSTWFIPTKNELKWTSDGKILYFGFKPLSEKDTLETDDMKLSKDNFYNQDSVMSKADVLVWNSMDSRIRSNYDLWWKDNKNKVYRAVYNLESKNYTFLASHNLPEVEINSNSKFTISLDQSPYLKNLTWYGDIYDLYVINLKNANKIKIAEKIEENAYISPSGNFVTFFKDKHWFIYDVNNDSTFNITQKSKVKYYDEDHDTPGNPPSYGFAGWIENDDGFYIYDKYDIWYLSTKDIGTRLNATGVNGRANKITYRFVNLDPDKKAFLLKDTMLIEAFDHNLKVSNFAYMVTNAMGTQTLTHEENKNLKLIAKAKDTDKYLFSRESFDEFPDLWISDFYFKTNKKITDVNPQMKDFLWGKTELIKWVNSTNDSLEGYLIKPDNFDAKKKYPMLVYFYEKFSDETNRFYQPRMGHRPIYQNYLSDGYCVFVPDVVYKIGSPGNSAVDCITSGVQKIIDMGVADKSKLCIQGHSWAAYQISHIITKTNMFAAAAAGAPVGNMTSAYSQIRPGTGLARQFQYEAQQSRIGGTLWDSLNSYMANSPVFHAPQVSTPFLILHGDNDDAVPFEQGVELYLALRRLGKPCWFIQYNNEPHHPRKYENKLDWQIKMKDFFDHFLLGKPIKPWMKPDYKTNNE